MSHLRQSVRLCRGTGSEVIQPPKLWTLELVRAAVFSGLALEGSALRARLLTVAVNQPRGQGVPELLTNCSVMVLCDIVILSAAKSWDPG